MPYTSLTNISEPTVPQFTAEEKARFELRFEEGFDLYNPRYIWHGWNVITLKVFQLIATHLSLLCHIVKMDTKHHTYYRTSPLSIQLMLCSFQMKLYTLTYGFYPPQKWFARTFETFRGNAVTCGFHHTFACGFYPLEQESTGVLWKLWYYTLTSGFTPGSSGSTASSGQELTYISKYLVQYVPGTPKPRATTKRVSGYQVLTSSKCLAVLEEKEKRKQEWAEKKQQRDELLKKDEEKARKAEEKKKMWRTKVQITNFMNTETQQQ